MPKGGSLVRGRQGEALRCTGRALWAGAWCTLYTTHGEQVQVQCLRVGTMRRLSAAGREQVPQGEEDTRVCNHHQHHYPAHRRDHRRQRRWVGYKEHQPRNGRQHHCRRTRRFGRWAAPGAHHSGPPRCHGWRGRHRLRDRAAGRRRGRWCHPDGDCGRHQEYHEQLGLNVLWTMAARGTSLRVLVGACGSAPWPRAAGFTLADR